MQARILDGDKLRTTTDPADIRAALAEGQRIWIDLERQTPEADALLASALQLHPLTIEDIWADRSRPKIDDFDAYLYLIVHGIGAARHDKLEAVEIDLVIGPNWLVTHDPAGLVTNVTANWEAVTAEEAQRLANEGILVVAGTQNPGDHGHTMVVVPGKLQIASDGKPYPMVAGGAMSAGGSSDGSKSAGQCWPRQSSPGRPGRDQIQYFTPR